MADTISYIQAHGFDTWQDLMAALSDVGTQAGEMQTALRTTEQRLKEVNEQVLPQLSVLILYFLQRL